MKASEYYEKYKDKLNTEEGIWELYREMSLELNEILIARNAKFNSALYAATKEMNQRWNAVRHLDVIANGVANHSSMIAFNGFMTLWKHKMPVLADIEKRINWGKNHG